LAEAMTNYTQRIASAQGAYDAIADYHSKMQKKLQAKELLLAQQKVADACDEFASAAKALEDQKTRVRTLAEAVADEAERLSADEKEDLSAATQLMADLANFCAQCDVAIQLGEKEEETSKQAQQ